MTDSDPALADYAVVLIGAVFVFATASWLISAHKWFKGPVVSYWLLGGVVSTNLIASPS